MSGSPEPREQEKQPKLEHGGAQAGAVDAGARTAGSGLSDLAAERLKRLARLRTAEARLGEAAWRKLAGTGKRAIRQIELDRQRLGRELHTGIGQMLAAIRLQVGVVEAAIPSPPPAAQQALERISTIAEEALEQVRDVARRLHPPQWQRLSLDAALRQLCQVSGVNSRFETVLRIQPLEFDPGVEVKSLFYRAAQEALSNVIRHSRATRIVLIFQQVQDRLVLQVRDNGVGVQATRAQATKAAVPVSSGMGLESIREQARYLGGKLLIRSSKIGTILEVSVRVRPNFP